MSDWLLPLADFQFLRRALAGSMILAVSMAPLGTMLILRRMSLVGAEFGVGAAVAALHAVRLITVLVVMPLVVKVLLPMGQSPPPS